MMDMACSGHERIASATLVSWLAGISPSMAEEWPSTSSSWNTCGAIIAHRVCPWQCSGSTYTFTFFLQEIQRQSSRTGACFDSPGKAGCSSFVEVVPLEVSAGVHVPWMPDPPGWKRDFRVREHYSRL